MRAVVLAIVLSGVAVAQSSSNVSGKWQIEIPVAAGGAAGPNPARPIVQILTLNHVGAAVAGELVTSGGPGSGLGSTAPVNNEVHDGKVDGLSVSFYVWRGNDRPAKTFYQGTLNARGDEIAFVITGGPPPRLSPPGTAPPAQQATAKRMR